MIDLRDRLLIGLVRAIDLDGFLLTEIVYTLDLRNNHLNGFV